MAAATAALLSAAGRRLSRSSASTILCREVIGRHKLTIDGCTPSPSTKLIPAATSKPFDVAGYSWTIAYKPYWSFFKGEFISLELAYGGWRQMDPVKFTFTLLDRAGEPVPEFSRSTAETCWFDGESMPTHGFRDFISWEDLEASGCLNDGRFAVQCDIAVIKDRAKNDDVAASSSPAPAIVDVPPPSLHEHLGKLLSRNQGTDVTIHVGGGEEVLDAHGWLLAARSPVFEAELLAAVREKVPGGGGVRRRVEIDGVKPRVFKAMLHFMYTDALPPEMMEEGDDGGDAMATARGLLAAAHRYKLERLKLMCEEMLCRRIDVNTVASSLMVAEQLGCRALKDACFEFMAAPGNRKAVMETEGYEKMKANCPVVLAEFLMRQLP